ncbi:MAG: hypothetical protein IIT79_02220 [Aeriscardovia sp.]|nr:hypothetical protein [Aeriscardovia sp.]
MITNEIPSTSRPKPYKIGGKMEDNKYTEIFNELNIPIKSLPENYTPDEFMHKLLLESSTWKEELEIFYTTSTDCALERLDTVPIEPREEWI